MQSTPNGQKMATNLDSLAEARTMSWLPHQGKHNYARSLRAKARIQKRKAKRRGT